MGEAPPGGGHPRLAGPVRCGHRHRQPAGSSGPRGRSAGKGVSDSRRNQTGAVPPRLAPQTMPKPPGNPSETGQRTG